MANPYGNKSYRVSQAYGPTQNTAEPAYGGHAHFHRGIDLVGAPGNTPIFSISNGTVYSARADADKAIYCIVLGDDDYWYCYWHLSRLTVAAGQRVAVGTQLGNQGSTGVSTGNHLHLEIEQPGTWLGLLKMTPVDPTPYLAGLGGGPIMSTSVNDYLQHPDKNAEKMWIWVLAEAFQKVNFGTYSDMAADGHISAILAGMSRAALARTFAQDGGWRAPEAVQALQKAKESAESTAATLHGKIQRADEAVADALSRANTANGRAATAEKALKDLQNAPKGISVQECQARIDTAVQRNQAVVSRYYESNPWPAVSIWTQNRLADWATAIGNALKLGGDR